MVHLVNWSDSVSPRVETWRWMAEGGGGKRSLELKELREASVLYVLLRRLLKSHIDLKKWGRGEDSDLWGEGGGQDGMTTE